MISSGRGREPKSFLLSECWVRAVVCDTQKRKSGEIKALIKAKEALNCQDLKIITWEFDGTISKNGHLIRCIPLVKWLLE